MKSPCCLFVHESPITPFNPFTRFYEIRYGCHVIECYYEATPLIPYGSRDSSGSVVSGYALCDRAIEVRSPMETEDFSSNLCVQTGSGAHPPSCTMGTAGPFRGDKARPGRDTDHSAHLVPRL
jgi:hypothetical protein